MFSIYFPPHPALADFVEVICIMGHDFNAGNFLSPVYTFMPTHTRFLCFYLGDEVTVRNGLAEFENHGRSVIIGPQITPVTLDLGKRNSNLLVVLKPCALYRILGVPLHELVDQYFDASLIFGEKINYITEQLMAAKSGVEKNDLIQTYLLDLKHSLKPMLPIDLGMKMLISSNGKFTMDALAKKCCLSNRQLERQSLQRIGLSPKYFARLIRFSEAYKFKEKNPQTTWTVIAHHFGYFDQMHLVRDFHEFTGSNPGVHKEEKILHSVRYNSLVT